MSFKITAVILVSMCSLAKTSIAQDTLSCKKELTWDKTNKYYYKTNDASKAKYTGPAKCYPQKGVENRGYLKNGSWEGIVYGYKEGRVLGFATFKNGFYDGLTVKYNELGEVRDSIIIKDQIEVYRKLTTFNKTGSIKEICETTRNGSDVMLKFHYFDTGEEIEQEIRRFTNNKKNGAWETAYPEYDQEQRVIFLTSTYKFYDNNQLLSERFYDGGQLYRAEFYSQGKKTKEVVYHGDISKIESEVNFVNGKISGEVIHYDENGKLSYIEKYEKGKLMETTEQ